MDRDKERTPLMSGNQHNFYNQEAPEGTSSSCLPRWPPWLRRLCCCCCEDDQEQIKGDADGGRNPKRPARERNQQEIRDDAATERIRDIIEKWTHVSGEQQLQMKKKKEESEMLQYMVRLEEKRCNRARRVLTEKRERYAEQQRQAIAEDAHFQVMDDENSRDKLVRKYAQLYDKSDLVCQAMEETLTLNYVHEHNVDVEASKLLQEVLLNSFRTAKDLLENFAEALWCEVYSLLYSSSTTAHARSDKTSEGIQRLAKQILRRSEAATPSMIFEKMMACMEDEALYKTLLQHSSMAPKGGDGQQALSENQPNNNRPNPAIKELTEYTETCAQLAWRFQILPVAVTVREEDPANQDLTFQKEFHELHASSDLKSKVVKEVLWPVLLICGQADLCLRKGIVITGHKGINLSTSLKDKMEGLPPQEDQSCSSSTMDATGDEVGEQDERYNVGNENSTSTYEDHANPVDTRSGEDPVNRQAIDAQLEKENDHHNQQAIDADILAKPEMEPDYCSQEVIDLQPEMELDHGSQDAINPQPEMELDHSSQEASDAQLEMEPDQPPYQPEEETTEDHTKQDIDPIAQAKSGFGNEEVLASQPEVVDSNRETEETLI